MTKADTPLLAATSPNGTILYSDESEMESSLHYFQLMLLVSCLYFYWRDRTDYFIGANLTIYYSRYRIRTRDSRGLVAASFELSVEEVSAIVARNDDSN